MAISNTKAHSCSDPPIIVVVITPPLPRDGGMARTAIKFMPST